MSHVNGSAAEGAKMKAVRRVLSRLTKSTQTQIIFTESFVHKEAKNLQAYARWGAARQKASLFLYEQAIEAFLRAEPMLLGTLDFGGTMLIIAPIDTDAIEGDVRDLIFTSFPHAVLATQGTTIQNTLGHSHTVGISNKKDSYELRSCRNTVHHEVPPHADPFFTPPPLTPNPKEITQKPFFVHPGNIIGLPPFFCFKAAGCAAHHDLLNALFLAVDQHAKVLPHQFKRTLITQATFLNAKSLRALIDLFQTDPALAFALNRNLLNQILGSCDYHLFHLHTVVNFIYFDITSKLYVFI